MHETIDNKTIWTTHRTPMNAGPRRHYDRAADFITYAQLYALAEKYDIEEVKEIAIEFVRDMDWGVSLYGIFLAIEITWSTTPASDRGLRDAFLKQMSRLIEDEHKLHHVDHTSGSSRSVWDEEFKKLFRSHPDFAVDYLSLLVPRSNIAWSPDRSGRW